MYIIACRAHFCHLLGLGQVGHSPRETSGSAWTLERGPCLDFVRKVTPQGEPVGVLGPWTWAQYGWLPVHLPPQCTPDTPTPLEDSNAPLCYLYPFWLLSTYTPCQPPIHPWHVLHPLMPPNSPNTPYTPKSHQCLLMPPIPFLAPEYLHSLSAPNTSLTPATPWCPLMAPNTPTPPRRPQMSLMLPTFLLAPEYLHSLPASHTPWHPYTIWCPLTTPSTPYTPSEPQCPLCHLYPSGPWVSTLPASTPIHPSHPLYLWFPLTLPNGSQHPYTP